ncbi:hypothetical protein D3C84_1067030 [compost metagenome]
MLLLPFCRGIAEPRDFSSSTLYALIQFDEKLLTRGLLRIREKLALEQSERIVDLDDLFAGF